MNVVGPLPENLMTMAQWVGIFSEVKIVDLYVTAFTENTVGTEEVATAWKFCNSPWLLAWSWKATI